MKKLLFVIPILISLNTFAQEFRDIFKPGNYTVNNIQEVQEKGGYKAMRDLEENKVRTIKKAFEILERQDYELVVSFETFETVGPMTSSWHDTHFLFRKREEEGQ